MTPLWELPKAVVNPKYPDIKVRLVGFDGNIFSIMGRITVAMKAAGVSDSEQFHFIDEVTGCDSYEDALLICAGWVSVF